MNKKKMSCEKALFLRNMGKCWFVPLIVFGSVTAMLVIILYATEKEATYVGEVLGGITESFANWLILAGIMLGMLSFDYLHKWNSVSFYQALPITRTRIFLTLTLSNLALILMSAVGCGISEIIIVKAIGAELPKEAAVLFIYIALMQILACSITSFCMILGGNILASAAYTVILIFGGMYIYMGMQIMSSDFLWSGRETFDLPDVAFYMLFPNRLIPYSVNMSTSIVSMDPLKVFLCMLILTAFYIALSIIVYRFFEPERTGKAVTVSTLNFWVKLICSAAVASLTGSVIFEAVIKIRFSPTARVLNVVVFVALILVCFYFFSALQNRSLIGIRKKEAVKLVIALCVFAAIAVIFERSVKRQVIGLPEDISLEKVTMLTAVPGESPAQGDMSDEEYEIVINEYFKEHFCVSIVEDRETLEEIKTLYREYYEAADDYDYGKLRDFYFDSDVSTNEESEFKAIHIMFFTEEHESPRKTRDVELPVNHPVLVRLIEIMENNRVEREEYIATVNGD